MSAKIYRLFVNQNSSSALLIMKFRLVIAMGALSLFLAGAGSQSNETPLSPEFLEYLGDVEAPGLFGPELQDFDEIFKLVKNFIREAVTPKNIQDNKTTKDDVHGNPANK